MATSRAIYQRQQRQAHAALGLCRFCAGKRAPGRTACQRHLDYLKAWKASRKAAA